MIPAVAIASIAAFIVAFAALGVARVAGHVFAVAQTALGAMRDSSIDDSAREKIVQQASLQMIGVCFAIFFRSAAALLAGLVPILLADRAGLAGQDAVIGYLSRIDVIAVAALVMIVGHVVWMRLRRQA
jgi:hypothetical protein